MSNGFGPLFNFYGTQFVFADVEDIGAEILYFVVQDRGNLSKKMSRIEPILRNVEG